MGAGDPSASDLGDFQMPSGPLRLPSGSCALCLRTVEGVGGGPWPDAEILFFFFLANWRLLGRQTCGEKVPSRAEQAALGSVVGQSLRWEGSNEDSQEKGARGTQVQDAGGQGPESPRTWKL